MLQAVFTDNTNYIKVSGLTQWDYGQKLEITLAGLPESFEAHFAYRGATEAPVVKGTAVDGVATVPIPNILTTQKNDAVCWLYYKDGESGETVKTILLPIKARPKPTDYVYTETEVKTWTKLEERIGDIEKNSAETIKQAVNDYLKENPLEENDPTVPEWAKSKEKPKYTASEVGALSEKELQSAIDTALTQAKESGEFKGEKGDDGKTPVKGTDYFTEADKQAFVTDVLEALPTWTGGSY